MRPEMVILDLAGTTIEDRGQVPAAFTAALAEQGIELSAEQVERLRGAAKREAIGRLIPAGPARAARAAAAFAAFQRHLAERYAVVPVRALPGAEPAMRWLRERGVRVALATGFDRPTTELLLSALGWTGGWADAVVCGDDVRRGRPAPDLIFQAMALCGTASPDRVANVGDTTRDLQSGHHAGVRWNIGVLSGAHSRELLERAPHTHLLAGVGELPRLWSEDA